MKQTLVFFCALLVGAGVVYALVVVGGEMRRVSADLDTLTGDVGALTEDVKSIADDVNAIADAVAPEPDGDEAQSCPAPAGFAQREKAIPGSRDAGRRLPAAIVATRRAAAIVAARRAACGAPHACARPRVLAARHPAW